MDLSASIALVALVVSAFALWRSELRGPCVHLRSVPGSAEAVLGSVTRQAENKPIDRLAVNVYVEAVFVNDGHRGGYVHDVHCAVPDGRWEGLEPLSTHAGFVQKGGMVPQPHRRIAIAVERDHSQTIAFGWWFIFADPAQEEGVKGAIRNTRGPIALTVTWTSLEAFLVWPRFKTRTVTIRPKQRGTDLVRWGAGPYAA